MKNILQSPQKSFFWSVIISILLLILITLNSCVLTEKQKQKFLSNNCERKDSTVRITEDRLIYKDTTLYITQQGDPIYITNPCDSLGHLKNIKSTANKVGIKSSVKTVGNSLVFMCETDSLKYRIKWLEHRIKTTEISHTESKVEKECELKHRNSIDYTCRWFTLIALCLLGLKYGWVFAKQHLKMFD